ncbi:MAG: crossover junction endodeoxyribonuclease RuvC [Thermoflexales bacterium]|nr:crossover junction endodeoxyribonuclease RuvC [Thermoflexales bacterium]
MRILGLDPGTAITGYGLIEEHGGGLAVLAYGVIGTPAGLALPKRLQKIYSELRDLIQSGQPEVGAVEQLFFSRNARTALAVGHARGVILLALANADVPVVEYTPLQVKQALSGYGRAGKSQIQEMVRLILELEVVPQPDDAADALAVAICHAHSARWAALGAAP